MRSAVGWGLGGCCTFEIQKGHFLLLIQFILNCLLTNNSKLNPISPLEGSVVVVVFLFFFLPFPFPFSAFVAHLLQSTSLQEPKLNKLPICHASLVVCSPHHHLAYLLSQKEKERERERAKRGRGKGRQGSRARRGKRGEREREEGGE